jgi:hypothetical protein
MQQVGRTWVGIAMMELYIYFFNLPNPPSRVMALGLTQRLIEMATRRSFWRVERGRRVADNLTAVREPIILKIWDPRHVITL